jgi:hypothetical protein
MLLELRFSVCTLGLGVGTFVAALYGMNLKSWIEESDYGFYSVSSACFILSAVAFWYGMGRLRRVQRVSMWGEYGPERGLGLAKRGFKETMKGVEEERNSRKFWGGFGRSTPPVDVAFSSAANEARERARRVASEGAKRSHFPQNHGYWPHTRRRKFAHPEGEPSSPSGGLGTTTSGLGTGKPPGGSTVLD